MCIYIQKYISVYIYNSKETASQIVFEGYFPKGMHKYAWCIPFI